MNITDSRILALVGYSLILGVALGVCFLLISLIRLMLTPTRTEGVKSRFYVDLVTFIFDILFALFSAVSVSLLFFGANDGDVRLLGLVGCTAGFVLWHCLAGRRIICAAGRAVALGRRLIKRAFCLTVLPVVSFIICPFRGLIADYKAVREKKKKEKEKKRSKKGERALHCSLTDSYFCFIIDTCTAQAVGCA